MATYSNIKLPRKRAYLSMVAVIVLVLSLALSFLSQLNANNNISGGLPSFSSSFVLLGQVFVGFIAILASISEIIGFSIRDLFGGKPPSTNVEDFPFYVIQDVDELATYLFPSPKNPILPDKNIPFSSRIKNELDVAFRSNDRILVRGRSKTGKTREVVELIKRFWYLNPTILLLKNHIELSPNSFVIPKDLPTDNLILLIDDIDRFCDDEESLKNLGDTIDLVSGLCRKQNKLKVVATVRQEPEVWDKLKYRKENKLWKSFSITDVNPLTKNETLEFLKAMTVNNDIKVDDDVLSVIASKNNGTYLNVILSTRNWLMKEQSEIKAKDIETFTGELALTWDQRYKNLLDNNRLVGPTYAAISIIERLNLPLVPQFVVDIATELSLGKVYHIFSGIYAWTISKIGLSPMLEPFTNSKSKHRNRFLLVLAILIIIYVLSYLMFRYASLYYLSSVYWLDNNLPIRLKILSPVIVFLIIYVIFWTVNAIKSIRRRRIFSVLRKLMENEIRMRGHELLPYEGQFAGKGESRTLPIEYFLQNSNLSYSMTAGLNLKISEIYWKWADHFRENGEFKSAEILGTLSGEYAPYHPVPSFILGSICFDRADYENAIKYLSDSVKLNKTIAANSALAKIAWSYYFDDDLSNAVKTAQRLISLDPLFGDAYWIKGICLIRQGQENDGVAEIKKAVVFESQLSANVRSLIDTLHTNPDYSKINLLIQPLIENKKRFRNTLSLSKFIYTGFSFALLAGFGWFILFWGPRLIEEAKNDSEFRLKVVQLFNRIYPNTPWWLFSLGHQYCSGDDEILGLKYYTAALELKQEPIIYTNRYKCYRWLGRDDEAKYDLLTAISLDPMYPYGHPDHYSPYDGLISLYGINMNDDEFMALVEKYPEVPYVYSTRAAIYERQGMLEEAIKDWGKAIELMPDIPVVSSEFYCERGDMKRNSGDFEDALDDYNSGIRFDTVNYSCNFGRAITFHEMDKYEEAISDYTTVIEQYPDYSTSYYNRGLIYQIQGEREKAIVDFQRYLELETTSYWIDQAKQRLKELGVVVP